MPPLESDDAELTIVTPRQPEDDRDRAEVGAELEAIRSSLGMSVRALAERISVDRETLRKILDGDQTVTRRKLATVEAQIRALDQEMGTERQDEAPAADVVEIRVEPAAGMPGATVTLRGSASNPDLQDFVAGLVKKMSEPHPD